MTRKLYRSDNGTPIQSTTVDINGWQPVTTYPTTPHRLTATTQFRTGSWISDDDRAELERKAELLSNLLAVIHGDGGHYESDNGTIKAVDDAMKKVIDTKGELDDLTRLMPCGHSGRYAYTSDENEGTTFCLICEFVEDSTRLNKIRFSDSLTSRARGVRLGGKKKKTRQ